MIIAQQKAFDEIAEMISSYGRVLILGCGTCTTVCGAGGEREVSYIHRALKVVEKTGNYGRNRTFREATLKRQCDPEFIDQLTGSIGEVDAILSLACGIGVQAVAERFAEIPVLPGLNTLFMGVTREGGIWDEWCAACGNCQLDETGGICPIARCTKGLLNGPCAGTKNGKCEANREMDCAWVLIYKRLESLGKLDKMRKYYPPLNFRTAPRPRRIVGKSFSGGPDG